MNTLDFETLRFSTLSKFNWLRLLPDISDNLPLSVQPTRKFLKPLKPSQKGETEIVCEFLSWSIFLRSWTVRLLWVFCDDSSEWSANWIEEKNNNIDAISGCERQRWKRVATYTVEVAKRPLLQCKQCLQGTRETKQKQNQRFVLRKIREGEQGRRTKTQDKQLTKSWPINLFLLIVPKGPRMAPLFCPFLRFSCRWPRLTLIDIAHAVGLAHQVGCL